jgi:hypothetical protein
MPSAILWGSKKAPIRCRVDAGTILSDVPGSRMATNKFLFFINYPVLGI